MITINLLPAEYRSRKSTLTALPYVPLVILFGVLFLLLTLFFFFDYLKARSAYGRVYKEWQQISPQMRQLKALESRFEIEMKSEKDFLEKNILNEDPMTRILQWVSEYLPPRAWLTEMKLEREGDGGRLILQGDVYPMSSKTGIEQIEDYMRMLTAKLPTGSFSLTTSKQNDKHAEGTAFAATFEWGMKKP